MYDLFHAKCYFLLKLLLLGAVKVTPAHSIQDFEVGKRHNLPIIEMLDDKGCIIGYEPINVGLKFVYM